MGAAIYDVSQFMQIEQVDVYYTPSGGSGVVGGFDTTTRTLWQHGVGRSFVSGGKESSATFDWEIELSDQPSQDALVPAGTVYIRLIDNDPSGFEATRFRAVDPLTVDFLDASGNVLSSVSSTTLNPANSFGGGGVGDFSYGSDRLVINLTGGSIPAGGDTLVAIGPFLDGHSAGDTITLIDAPFDAWPPAQDGTVFGTGGGDLIDATYVDPADGEMVDNGDALGLHGEGILNDADSIVSFGGNDTIFSGGGNDTIVASDGNNQVDGGDGDDVITVGAGDDTIVGGTGTNIVTGGDGNDRFEFTVGEELNITDFGTGSTNADDGDNTNNDFVDLSTFYSDAAQLKADLADDGIANQSDGSDYSGLQDITDAGASSGVSGLSALQTASNSSIEEQTGVPASAPVCFTPYNLILTSKGQTPVGSLKVGDLVQTKDDGLQPIRWIYFRHLPATELKHAPHFRPIRIRKGSFGDGVPERDMMVSPGHMMLTTNRDALRVWKGSEALVSAGRLASSISSVELALPPAGVTYIHLLFDRHQIVHVDGVWTESYRPGRGIFSQLGARYREVYELFPELSHKDPLRVFPPARESYYGRRANRLARRIKKFGML